MKKLLSGFLFLVAMFSLIGVISSPAEAVDYYGAYCWNLSVNGQTAGLIKLAVSDMGDQHFILNGTSTNTSTTGVAAIQGNAEIVNNKIIATLNASHIDQYATSISTTYLSLDTSLNGTFKSIAQDYNYSQKTFEPLDHTEGTATFITCPTTDTTPPSVPTGLTAIAISSSQINLAWNASTDNIGVTGYKIYRDGSQITTSTDTSYNNTGLSANTQYCYQVSAYDAAGNESAKSGQVCATTSVESPSNYSGDWNITATYNGRTGTLTPLTLVQSGNNITLRNTCDSALMGSGVISGSTITFSSSYDCANINFTGTTNVTTITGTFTASNGYSGTFTMTRNTEGGCAQKSIPTASIVVDGNASDWSGISPIITDATGDGNSSVSGSDIHKVYMAKDSTNLYIRLEMANGSPSSDLYIGIDVYAKTQQQAGDRMIFFNFPNWISVDTRDSACGGYHNNHLAYGTMVVNGNVIEASVPLSALNPPSPSYIRVHDDAEHLGLDSIDNTVTIKAIF